MLEPYIPPNLFYIRKICEQNCDIETKNLFESRKFGTVDNTCS